MKTFDEKKIAIDNAKTHTHAIKSCVDQIASSFCMRSPDVHGLIIQRRVFVEFMLKTLEASFFHITNIILFFIIIHDREWR